MSERYKMRISEIEGFLEIENHIDLGYDGTKELSDCSPIGIHGEDRGFVYPAIISKDFKVLYCKVCGMRILIPRTVKTYNDLEKHLTEERTKKKEENNINKGG